MLKHAAIRVLILLPAIWLIASVVFLLSKSVPGSASEMEMEATVQNANSRAKAEAYQRAYKQMLHKTGQDLPLFYVGFGTAAAPDTLYKITSATDQAALNRLIFTYGNWEQISAYYKSLQHLKEIIRRQTLGNQNFQEDLQLTQDALQATEPANVKKALAKLRSVKELSANMVFRKAVLAADRNFDQVINGATPRLNYVPSFKWYGFENQYHRWFKNLLKGNLGFSSRDSRPVSEILGEAFAVTFWLALAAFLLVGLLAPELGMVLSLKSAGKWRGFILNLLYGLESVPLFLIALSVLALSSYFGLLYDFPEEVSKLLVVFCLVLVNLPYLTGQAYGAMQKVLRENFILTARAKGLPDKQVLRRHVLRNSLLPVITLLSDFFPALLAGTVILEVIFSVPGVGRLLVSSVLARDYEVITAIVLLVGFLKMASHLFADLLYAITDPRISR